MKKLFSVLAVLFVLGTTSTFALGIGAQAGYTVNGHTGASLTLKLDNLPPVFALDLNLGTNYIFFGGTADWWFGNPTIAGPLGFYYGAGIAAGFASANTWTALEFGPRLVAGLNLFPVDFLEFYLQAAWQPTFTLWLSGDNSGLSTAWGCVPLNLGFRFWIR